MKSFNPKKSFIFFSSLKPPKIYRFICTIPLPVYLLFSFPPFAAVHGVLRPSWLTVSPKSSLSMASAPLTHPLPEEIVVDILARLPVKSLKRFMCVGKSWCSLIQSPQFISAHYSFSKNMVYPIVKQGKHEDRTEGKNVLSIISNQTLVIVANLDIPSFSDEETSNVSIRGSCNGIVCLWYGNSDILLWNIATKETKTLPICPFESPPGFNNSVQVVCLGYDCKRDDYKVIRIDKFWDDDFEYEDPGSQRGKRVALYSLSSDSWRKLNSDLTLIEFIRYYEPQFYSNGFLHCDAFVENQRVLVSFDLSSEVFVTTQLHDSFKYGIFLLMEINGSVGGTNHRSIGGAFCDVWLLGEVGQKKSWIKLFTVGPIINYRVLPLGVGSDGKVFLSDQDYHNLLVWHHPSNQLIKYFHFQGYYLELAVYAESLVSLRGGSAFNN